MESFQTLIYSKTFHTNSASKALHRSLIKYTIMKLKLKKSPNHV